MPERRPPVSGASIADQLVSATSGSRKHDWNTEDVPHPIPEGRDPFEFVSCKKCGQTMQESWAYAAGDLYKSCPGRPASPV